MRYQLVPTSTLLRSLTARIRTAIIITVDLNYAAERSQAAQRARAAEAVAAQVVPVGFITERRRDALSTQKENHAVPRPKDRSRPILIQNHSCSPDQGDKTRRAKSRLCKQIRRIAIDRSEKQVRLAKRCEELILLVRNFVGSAGRVLKMFSESARESDINLKIFLNQKLSLSEYLDDLDKQVSSIRSDDIDMSKENEELRLEIDRLSKVLRKETKEGTNKDPRDKIHQELRKDELETLKRFVKERMESEVTEFGRLLEFTQKQYRLKLILFQKDRELSREKESELNEMIKFVRGEYEQQILGRQHSQRVAVLSETAKTNTEEKALTHKIKQLLKYLKVEYVEGKPNNAMYLLEMLELKLYNLKIELLPTIRRQNEAYVKEIKQLRVEIDTLNEDNRRLAASKANLTHLEDEVRILRDELFKFEQVKQPQYFSSNQHQLRNAERERAQLEKQNIELAKQLSELEKEKVRLEGIVNKVFEQLQSVCVNNGLVKREELRDLNYQGLMDVIQHSIGENKTRDREEREDRERERRRTDNLQQQSSNKIAELEKGMQTLGKALTDLEEEFEMVLSQKLQLEEHMERTRATHHAQVDQLRQQLQSCTDKLKRIQEKLLVTAESQTQVDSNRWDNMQKLTESLKESVARQHRELTETHAQLHALQCEHEETMAILDNCRQEVIHLSNCLGESKSELQASTYRCEQLIMQLNEKEQQCARTTTELKELAKSKDQVEALVKEQEARCRQLAIHSEECSGKLEILQMMVVDRDSLLSSLNGKIAEMQQEEKRVRQQGEELQTELRQTTSKITELKAAYQSVNRELQCKKSTLQSVELQLESFELDFRAKSLELTALRESNLRSSQQLLSVNMQAQTCEKLESQVEQLLRKLAEKEEENNRLRHQTISLTIVEEENVRIKKELESQEAMVRLLDTQLTNQIKLKEEVSCLKEQAQFLQQEIDERELKIGNLQRALCDIGTSVSEQLQRHTTDICSIITGKIEAEQLKIASISMRLRGLSRKQSVQTEEHTRTKELLLEYSGSCNQLQLEISRLVGQLEEFRSKAELQRNRKLEDAVRSSEKLKHEKQQLSESMQKSQALIEEQEEKIRQYEVQLSQYSGLQQSLQTPDKADLLGSYEKPDNRSQHLQSCSKVIDFKSIMVGAKEAETQTEFNLADTLHEQLAQLREHVQHQFDEFMCWLSEVSDGCTREMKSLTDRLEERSIELVRAVGRKFKIVYTGDNILEQTIRFINEFEFERKESLASNYFEVLERLVEELLFSRVNLNLQQQLKTLQPAQKDKILGYRKKIADLQFQLSSKDELKDKMATLEAEIAALKSDIKAKQKRIGYYENEVSEKETQIAELKTKKPEPLLNLSEQSQSLFLMLEEDLIEKDFGTASAETLNELLDVLLFLLQQSGICSDELGFTKAELTKCLRENTSLREKLRNARHHLKRIVDLIESHSGGSETNAKIYEAVLSCRSTLA